MITHTHPSSLLHNDWIALIRSMGKPAEEKGMLTDSMLELVYEQGWFKILTPEKYGGMEMPLPDAVRLEEALSWADGSLGWTVTLCTGAEWFGGFLRPSFAKNIFNDPKVCFCGSGAITGTAEIVDDGYKINGKWLYATGAPHATVFTANCLIIQNGITVKNEDGSDLVLSFAFLKDEVAILPQWYTVGLIATASYPFEVKDLFVPEERTFKIDASALQIDTPLYHYPFLQLAETTLAANISGMAVHFVDLCEEHFSAKSKRDNTLLIDDKEVFSALMRAKNSLTETRINMYHALQQSWDCCLKHRTILGELLHMVSSSSRVLAHTARQVVDELYPFCGLSAADTRTELNRVWRDLHTASQHTLLQF